MADVLSTWAANMALTSIPPKGSYLALHLTNPGPLGSAATELAGGGYHRRPISFSLPANRSRASTNAQNFPSLPACVIRYLAVWTAIAGGHMIFAKQLNPAIVVSASGQFLAAPGDVSITM